MDDDVIAQLTDGAYFGGERGLEDQTKLIWPHLHFIFNFEYLCDEKYMLPQTINGLGRSLIIWQNYEAKL